MTDQEGDIWSLVISSSGSGRAELSGTICNRDRHEGDSGVGSRKQPPHCWDDKLLFFGRRRVHVDGFVPSIQCLICTSDKIAVKFDQTGTKRADDGADHDLLDKTILHSGA